MDNLKLHKLGIDIGSTTVKIAILDDQNTLVFSDYERHFANIRETLTDLLHKAYEKLGQIQLCPMITGSGGLTLAKHLGVPFVQVSEFVLRCPDLSGWDEIPQPLVAELKRA